MKKALTAITIAVAALLSMAACASPPPAPSIAVTSSTVIIDVRTAPEYVGGHLQDAINIDVQSADFDTLITALPIDGDYIVYCATGNRSAAAVTRMADLGFTALTDAGGITDASAATGLAIVVDK
ncbi:rhodanese-like domain-containing protein [Cryobacterium glaciale]|uniref:Rhodanese-like domain-containing protein n=1 Tax=Cryobacterium glaciale TaxID=1259145 RepID=A0A4R8V7J9_9MICO|nr:rhodanese-like domain-containing protein [Cryobacterium glaciale]TFB77924.1 rhodanese-like domain-containing protein [Cryobacterium glaciale]